MGTTVTIPENLPGAPIGIVTTLILRDGILFHDNSDRP